MRRDLLNRDLINRDDFWRTNRMLNDFLSPIGDDLSFDVEEVEGHYVISTDIPGVPKDDIRLEIAGNQLTVSAQHEDSSKDEGGYFRRQRDFRRTLTLPFDIEASSVDATYQDGVLRIAIPKGENIPGVKTVSIKEGQQGFFSKFRNRKKEVGKSEAS